MGRLHKREGCIAIQAGMGTEMHATERESGTSREEIGEIGLGIGVCRRSLGGRKRVGSAESRKMKMQQKPA